MLADGDRTTWLRVQLNEDERSAQTELDLLRDYPYPDDFRIEYRWVRMAHHPHGGVSTTFAPGSPSPSQVLAEITAKRRMVARIEALMIYARAQGLDKVWDWAAESLKVEALPYADRPGFPEDWKA